MRPPQQLRSGYDITPSSPHVLLLLSSSRRLHLT